MFSVNWLSSRIHHSYSDFHDDTWIKPFHLNFLCPSYAALGVIAIACSGLHHVGHALMLGPIYPKRKAIMLSYNQLYG